MILNLIINKARGRISQITFVADVDVVPYRESIFNRNVRCNLFTNFKIVREI